MKEINIGKATAVTSPDPLVLVCTKKEDGTLNMAPVSFFMYASFNPPMLAFAMGKAANSGDNIRRTGKAILAVPGTSLKDAVMAYGSANGGKVDKLAKTPIALQSIDGTDIQIPEDCRIAFEVTLVQTVESGDHYLYLCSINKILADESKEALFAWDGYTKVAASEIKE
ncbi:MAG: flavin reductase family protein [Monoglobales bacterium]